jgi:hypothetical protein
MGISQLGILVITTQVSGPFLFIGSWLSAEDGEKSG